MLVGFQGRLGHGKTLSMSAIAVLAAKALKTQLYANYALIGARRFWMLEQLWATSGVVCIDEAWLSFDSRDAKKNIAITRWVNQSRKKKVVMMYTTQHIRQVDNRVRDATDYLMHCVRKNGEIRILMIDWQYREIVANFALKEPKRYYALYDTFETVEPLQ